MYQLKPEKQCRQKQDLYKLMPVAICRWCLLFLIFCTSSAFARQTMFEGYYLIKSGGVSVGYAIQRYEYDKEKKQFYSISYIQTNKLGGELQESLKAVSNDRFQPISFQFTSTSSGGTLATDAKFDGLKMTATATDGKNSKTFEKTFKKGTFLSSFLGYLMLQNGYKIGKKFNYSAIAEEDAEAYSGEAWIKNTETHKDMEVYRVFNTFKGAKFVNYVTTSGETLATRSPLQHIETELVRVPAMATNGQKLNTSTLKLLFGNVPTGNTNVLTKNIANENTAKKVNDNSTLPKTDVKPIGDKLKSVPDKKDANK